MSLPFVVAAPSDPFSFLGHQRPVYLWRGGFDISDFKRNELLQNTDPFVFVFDFRSSPADNPDVQAFLQDLVLAAVEKPQHVFFIVGDPRLLASTFENFFERPDFRALEQSMILPLDPSYPAPRYRRILKHIFVGSMFNSDDNPNLEHCLPWLMTVQYLRTFAWVNGPLDDDLSLEDLRPWDKDTPDHGDFDLFTGISYEVGSFRYRDSDNAFRKRFRPLSLAIFSLDDELADEQAGYLLSQADLSSEKNVPNLVLAGGRHKALERRGEEHRFSSEEILHILTKVDDFR